MDVNRERFCKKICKVVSTFAPRYNELILGDAVPHPVKAHVDALSAFRLDGVQSDAYSALVVAEDCSWARLHAHSITVSQLVLATWLFRLKISEC